MINQKLDIETFFNTDNLKRFYFPGKLLWGEDSRLRVFDLLRPEAKTAFFVDAFFEGHEFVSEIKRRLGGRMIFFEKIGGMPDTGNVRRIIKELGGPPEIVVSIGGGSTIDTAKAVMAHFIFGSFESVGIGKLRGAGPLEGAAKPLFISLPTTAGSGADASRYYVVYDSETRKKVYGKSWLLAADWIIMDPAFIVNSPAPVLIGTAFDAFVHSFESFLCKNERSWFGDMLSTEAISEILASLDGIIYRNDMGSENYLRLLYAATLSGVAVSNVRTGNIHEAGGALLEHSSLTHSETLFVFLRAAYGQYREHVRDREHLFAVSMEAKCPSLGIVSFDGLIEWWERTFERAGITASIKAKLKEIDSPLERLKADIHDRVVADKVWCQKESPRALDSGMVYDMINESFERFGLKP